MERNIQLKWQSFVVEAIKRRKEQKLTQKQLAVLAGVSKPTLNSFEQCKTTIKLDSALKILKVLGLAWFWIQNNGLKPKIYQKDAVQIWIVNTHFKPL